MKNSTVVQSYLEGVGPTQIETHQLKGFFKDDYPREFKEQWLRNNLMLNELKNWPLPHPSSATLLKGAHLITEKYYQHPGERFMGDIDLLIEEKMFEKWDHYLKSIGFTPYHSTSWEANEFKKLYLKELSPDFPFILELHFRLFYQQDQKTLLKTQEGQDLIAFQKLEKEECFVHLAGHLGYQHTFISFHWLIDIYLFLKKESHCLDWEYINSLSKKLHVQRSCRVICHLIKREFNIDSQMASTPLSLNERFLLQMISKKFLLHNNRQPFKYWVIKHLIKDNLKDALTYDFNWLKAR